jgi:DNA-binding transcriptional LysR family regulator
LYRYAKRLLALRQEVENALADYHGRYRGELAIGGSTIPGNYLLPSMLGGFQKRYAQIRLKLMVGDSQEIIHKILGGEVELALIGARYDDRDLHFRAIATDTMRLVVARGHPWDKVASVHVDDMCTEPFILRESGSGTQKAFEQGLREIGASVKDLNVVAEMGSTTAVLQGIKSGLGVSILSMLAVKEDLRAGTVRALNVEGLDLKRKFYLVRDKRRTTSPLARVFQEYLHATIPSAFNIGQHLTIPNGL